jgi:hypothetical protein
LDEFLAESDDVVFKMRRDAAAPDFDISKNAKETHEYER